MGMVVSASAKRASRYILLFACCFTFSKRKMHAWLAGPDLTTTAWQNGVFLTQLAYHANSFGYTNATIGIPLSTLEGCCEVYDGVKQ